MRAAGQARATEVEVSVADEGDVLAVEVRDDGVAGTEWPAGLLAVAERVAAVGGRLALEALPGGGSVVRAEVPVEA